MTPDQAATSLPTEIRPTRFGCHDLGDVGQQGASTSDRAGSLTSLPVNERLIITTERYDAPWHQLRTLDQPALTDESARAERAAARADWPGKVATLTQPDEGSADSRPEDCSSPAPGAPSGLPSSPISRDPLTDPRPGDVVAAADGGVLEVLDVLLGRGAGVVVREDSTRYRIAHCDWRLITVGGRVIHAAEGSSND